LEAGIRRIDDLFSAKAEELSLFSPAGRQPRRQTHLCLGGELRRFSAIYDGRGNVGRQSAGLGRKAMATIGSGKCHKRLRITGVKQIFGLIGDR
jgi:hypothetical protein